MSEFENEYDEDLIELIDEDNQVLTFTQLERFELNGNQYAVLAPVDAPETDDEEDVAFVFKVLTVDGEEVYEDVDDPEEWAAIEAFVEENVDLTME